MNKMGRAIRKGYVYGFGKNDVNEKTRTKNGKVLLKSYTVWKGLLRTCFSEIYHKKYKSAIGSTICDEWLLFSNFKKWYDENYRYDLEDKKIVVCLNSTILNEKGEKLYSPETCIFIPLSVHGELACRADRPTANEIKDIKKYLRKLGGYDDEFLSKIS